jgi:hypothetical protein
MFGGLGAQCPSQPPIGFIHRDSTRLIDGNGKPIRLRGPALGAWLTWEGWMWGASWQSETQMMSVFSDLVGRDSAEQFRSDVEATMVTADDFARMAQYGFNNVKLSINHRVLEDDANPFVYKPEGWALLDRILDDAQQNGIYVMLDLHAAPCGQMRAFPVDPGTDTDPNAILWDSSLCQSRTVSWWQAVAARYRDRTIVSGYDLLGEPYPNRCEGGPTPGAYCGPADSCGSGGTCIVHGDELASLYTQIVAGIRAVDPNHLIVLEGAQYSQDFSMFTQRLDNNMAYGPHDYLWDGGDPAALLQGWIGIAKRDDVPLWIGEMGLATTYADTTTQVQLYDGSPGVSGWAYWSWKMTPTHTWSWLSGTNKYLLGIITTPAWDAVMAWMNDPVFHPRPSADQAAQGLSEFLTSIRIENNAFDPQTLDALHSGM